ncbi:MAG TPA: hypothetical protein VMS17_11450 [Gemmataceae bacterium]|nr:hypothetical protein [Gemmataceae bacterium]
MAEAITIACPECDKKIHVPAEAVGKKIRCKGCEHVFVVPAPAGWKAAPAKAAPAKKAADPKAAKPKPAKPKVDDEDDPNPYGVTALDTAPRCPECANEMESEEAIICLICGYNTRTRSRAVSRSVEDVTGGTWFLWLLPGILYALGTCLILTFDLLYTFSLRFLWFGEAEKNEEWTAMFAHPGFVLWGVWAPSVIVMVGFVTFAVRRLILNPRPPEREKKKRKKEDED